jgi:hypothetical protein
VQGHRAPIVAKRGEDKVVFETTSTTAPRGEAPDMDSTTRHVLRHEDHRQLLDRIDPEALKAPAACADAFLLAECEHHRRRDREDVPRIAQGGIGWIVELSRPDERVPPRIFSVERSATRCSRAASRTRCAVPSITRSTL